MTPNGHVFGRTNLYLFKKMTSAIEHKFSLMGKFPLFELPITDGHRGRQRVKPGHSNQQRSELIPQYQARDQHDLATEPCVLRATRFRVRRVPWNGAAPAPRPSPVLWGVADAESPAGM